MASALDFGFSLNQFLHSPTQSNPSISSNPLPISQFSLSVVSAFPCSSSSSRNASFHFKLNKNPVQASAEELPNELAEDSKFVPLNPDDPTYGPPALLLLGFKLEEAVKIRQLLKELDGEFMEIIFCTEEMINRSLWEAVNTKQPNLKAVKIAESLPRVCILSGLSGEEMMMLIDAFPETGLEPAVFAALVPNSADKPLQELIEEIMGDHEMVSGKQSNSM